MFNYALRKIFGTKNDRLLKDLWPLVHKINDLEPEIKKLSNDDLKAQTGRFKQRIDNGEPLDSLLPEAFATTREAAIRTIGQRHFDVQMIGAIGLHRGMIAEMKTGEGKTLTSTAALYLNALSGKGAHVVTVNDYLAHRDAEWMGQIYRFLGMSVGNIVHGLNDAQRQVAYGSDITYGTNNEFGFDYLRDNMKFSLDEYVQRELNYAIVDEVDSILIDESRTPLIISGPSEESTEKYYTIDKIIPSLQKDVDYNLDEKSSTASLTEEGVVKVEKRLNVQNLFDPVNIELVHHVNQGLRAHTLFKRDVHYVVKDNQIVIVDEFTGRLMPGRRWSDGLHQAIEAKEGVRIEAENQTLATITFQNYFRMYNKLAGMTGTADTEAAEFKKIYDLSVLIVPTNKPNIRKDFPDVIYKTEGAKFKAIVNEIIELHEKGQPALVGTISIEKSERLSSMLKRKGVPHNVLNAKHHQREAEIVAQAGAKGSVTISTNMAGRGTDIILGGNPEFTAKAKADPDQDPEKYQRVLDEARAKCTEDNKIVKQVGGLHILGTERHDSRRIDNQLRGRAGRQGDEGSSRFFLSLEDDLMRIFGSERISKLMDTFNMDEDEPIEHRLVSRAIENAQRRVEGHHFDVRKHLLEYDDVMNEQRKVIYTWRRNVLQGDSTKDMALGMIDDIADELSFVLVNDKKKIEEWDFEEINNAGMTAYHCPFELSTASIKEVTINGLADAISANAKKYYEMKEEDLSSDVMRELEKWILLSTIDTSWKDHLRAMDHLREGIGLRGYAQKDPLQEYKKEGFNIFEMMINRVKGEVIQKIYTVQLASEDEVEQLKPRRSSSKQKLQSGAEASAPEAQRTASGSMSGTVMRDGKKTGRNDPCPCGSGKKYKRCCGK